MSAELNIQNAISQIKDLSRDDWFAQWQANGAVEFANLSWPTRKTENWKYTPVKSLQDSAWQVHQSDSRSAGIQFENWNEIRIDILNGVIRDCPELPSGVSLVKLSTCDSTSGQRFIELVEQTRSDFMFDKLNQTLLREGYWLKVEQGVQVDQPIHINHICEGDDVVASTQLLVEVGSNAKITLAESFYQEGSGRSFVNANASIFVDENAQVNHYHLLLEEGDVRHIGRVTASLGRFAKLTSFHMAVGGVLKRKDIAIRHRGEGAELSLNGVYLPKGKEVIDYHTTLEHEVPNCTSEEIFRGIIGDHAKAVFNGRIHIHKDAQKSLAEMNNRNLLLSDHAEINTKPELEIYADDVRCAHGATIAQLDQNLLFYFQARGISKAEAEVMLSFGFINELLDGLADEPVQQLLRPLLAGLFAKKQAELARHLV